MAKSQLITLDFLGATRIINLPDGVDPQDPATVAQLEAAVSGLAWKDNVRVSTQGNINLASPGATIDGVSMSASQTFLVRAQTATEENGIYVWNGAAVPATRETHANTMDELKSAVVTVDEGTDAGTTWRQTAVTGTIDVDPVTWTSFALVIAAASETVAGKIEIATQAETDTGTDDARAITPSKLANSVYARKNFAANFGDGAATSFIITHNFGSRDVTACVYRNSGNYDEVGVEIRHTTTNSVTVVVDSAPTNDQYRINVAK
jgi:hypothetical protein